jgi:hypothetical protein
VHASLASTVEVVMQWLEEGRLGDLEAMAGALAALQAPAATWPAAAPHAQALTAWVQAHARQLLGVRIKV